ncbi:MAG TPA: peptide deformylase [Blastocatellia bacterium]|nr:peptide deformylase [Blastocatellia bacterium]
MDLRLKILQAGEPVLRQKARQLSVEEIRSGATQELIDLMRETMRDAPGVGLAAPQIGLPLQLAVIEDDAERQSEIPPEVLAKRQRSPVPFHVIINPQLHVEPGAAVDFFEGCLSLEGFVGLVRRAGTVRVEYLNERAEPVVVQAHGWYARILQHEIDHLHGTLYLDRLSPRSLMTVENFNRYWADKSIEAIRAALEPSDYH